MVDSERHHPVATHAEPPVIPDTSGPLTVATRTSTYPLPAFPHRPHIG